MTTSTKNGTETIHVDRLPIVVTGDGVEKTLRVQILTSGGYNNIF